MISSRIMVNSLNLMVGNTKVNGLKARNMAKESILIWEGRQEKVSGSLAKR